MTSQIAHHFTVDVEEYFHVSAFEPFISRDMWDGFESRVDLGIERLLELLDRYSCRGTFFVLGWIADRNPSVVRRIADAGHEIASHGWDHRRVIHQTPHEFRESVRKSKGALEDLTGSAVLGFRAPSFSIVPGREWALDILIEEGYRYDSSLFPVRRNGYGYPNGLSHPHWLRREAGNLYEVPPTVLSKWGRNWPAAGGGYFRLLPYRIFQTALQQCEAARVPGTFYLHPWEVDPEQPRLRVKWSTRFRHYVGLANTQPRLERLFKDFRFTAVATHPELNGRAD